MKASLYPKSNLKILSKRFRKIRIENEYSLRGIARSENIAHTLISDIETGKVYPNVDTLKDLYKHVNIDLLVGEVELGILKRELDTYKSAVYFREDDMATVLLDKMREKHDVFMSSIFYIDYILALVLHSVVIEKRYDNLLLDEIESYYEDLSDELKKEFNLVKTSTLLYQLNIKAAKRYVNRNLSLKGSVSTAAMTYSLLATISKRLFQSYNAIDYAKKASDLHASQANLAEKLRADLLICHVLIEVERFKDAQIILNNISVSIEKNDTRTAFVDEYLHFLWSYYYFRKGDGDKALEFLIKDKSPTSLSEPAYYFFKAEILVKLNRYDEAIATLEQGLKKRRSKEVSLFDKLNTLYLWDLKDAYDADNFESLLLEVIDCPEKFIDLPVLNLTYRIGLNFYEYQGRCDAITALAKRFMNLPINK